MQKRISIIDGVVINSLVDSCVCHIGDSHIINAYNAVVALQRENATFDSNDADKAFKEIQDKEMQFPAYPDEVNMQVFHESPFIKVGPVRVVGIGSSSILHIGSTDDAYLQAKIRNIRQYTNQETVKTFPINYNFKNKAIITNEMEEF